MEIINSSKENALNFIEEIIEQDLKSGKCKSVLTRFPPEPNGYLHIGHAKSICLNFGLALKFGGKTNLRFDDTNPSKEEVEYVDSIKNDIKWLGFEWANEFYASDYFTQLFEFALILIRKGLAYVDDSSADEIAKSKGTPTTSGIGSIYRDRTIAENESLFLKMKAGEFPEGSKTLRAKIDLGSVNMHMRDPILYRIKFFPHHRTGNQWCIYPMYDFAHGQSDAIEQITHSVCTLEFIPHRELYDWFIEQLELFPSKQYEFARLNLTYTIMSKRKLLELVKENYVDGWDDPRLPTLSGLKRRGYTPESIREFCDRIGVAKRDSLIDMSLLEFCVREHLNKVAIRRMVVFNPIKVIIDNWEEGIVEELTSENNPEDPGAGTRTIPFSKELYIEADDFMVDPPKKYFRLAIGRSVRLKNAYIITCNDVINDEKGRPRELHCDYIKASRSGNDTSGVKVQGTIHWVSIPHAIPIQINEYDRLFTSENLALEESDFKDFINPNSLTINTNAFAEPSILESEMTDRFQFMRKGYYCPDKNFTKEKPIFNRTVTLKDAWAKISKE
ncbi:MAG: glutamine--tRNA ligase/YqeY domain fusion protein [Bacteroidota bacterium]|nr:glutamine--tRNA ligase/YqeY domain fusion protein [Bacteroidota bacterium]